MSEYRQQPLGRRVPIGTRPAGSIPKPPVGTPLAEAWERGKVAGKSITMRRMSDEPNAPEPLNPYEQEVSDD